MLVESLRCGCQKVAIYSLKVAFFRSYEEGEFFNFSMEVQHVICFFNRETEQKLKLAGG